MTEIENCNLLDTNVVFDIIYNTRKRSKAAIKFYSEFKNYELGIENIVLKESNKVILESAYEFINHFTNFLKKWKDQKNKSWNDSTYSERLRIIGDFKKHVFEEQGTNKYKEFIIDVIDKIGYRLSEMEVGEINKLFIELPGYLVNELNKQIKAKFRIITPYSPSSNDDFNDLDLLKNILNSIFKERSSFDRDILINLIILILNGDVYGNHYKHVDFYTEDEDFINNFNNACAKIEKEGLKVTLKDSFKKIAFLKGY